MAKTPRPAGKSGSAAKVQPASPSGDISYDLDTLLRRLGPPDAAFAERTFARVDEAALVEQGTSTDSQNILDDVPRFLGAALAVRDGLTPSQRALVRLPDAVFPLLAGETAALRALKAEHEGKSLDLAAEKAERETAARRAMREGIAERDLVYDGLRSALGDDRRAELDAVVGQADTPANLAKGLKGLASFIERARKANKHDAASLEDYGVGAACAKALRERAGRLGALTKVTASASRRVSQRALDQQDGRVLLLIEKIVRAFRAARRADPTILVPELNRLAWLFETRPRGKGGKKSEAPAGQGAEGAKGGSGP